MSGKTIVGETRFVRVKSVCKEKQGPSKRFMEEMLRQTDRKKCETP